MTLAIDSAAIPHQSLGRLFLRFLRFGSLAWGGPVAQIAMVQRKEPPHFGCGHQPAPRATSLGGPRLRPRA